MRIYVLCIYVPLVAFPLSRFPSPLPIPSTPLDPALSHVYSMFKRSCHHNITSQIVYKAKSSASAA